MKLQLKPWRWRLNAIALAMLGLLASCADDKVDDPDDVTDDPTEVEAPPKVESNGEVCALNAANIASSIPDYLKQQIESRFVALSGSVDASTKVVFASTAELSGKEDALLEAYANGATLVFLDTDKVSLLQWLDSHEIFYGGHADNYDDLHLIYAFNKRDRYYLFDDFVHEDSEDELAFFPVRFDSVVGWLNRYGSEEAEAAAMTRGGSDEYDISKTFASQVETHNYTVKLTDKTLASVALSDPDKLTMTSSIDVTLTVWPLYSHPSNGSSHGDYYIVKGYVNAHNAKMYNGKWTKTHGGVHARLCGFYMSQLDVEAKISGIEPKFPVGGTPVPQTTASATTYSSGFSWSIGGSLTGKYDAGGPGVEAGLSGSFSWNNSETRTLPDVSIRRDTDKGKINWEFKFNNLPHTSGGSKYLDIPDLATSDFETNFSWIWWIPGKPPRGNRKFEYQCCFTVKPTYQSYHWYSTAADFSTSTWDDGIKKTDTYFIFHLKHPYRPWD